MWWSAYWLLVIAGCLAGGFLQPLFGRTPRGRRLAFVAPIALLVLLGLPIWIKSFDVPDGRPREEDLYEGLLVVLVWTSICFAAVFAGYGVRRWVTPRA